MWVTKLLQVLVSYELTAYLSTFDLFLTPMTILSKGYKPDNFESHNSVKRNFTIIQNLSSNFLECEPQTLLTFLLYVRQSWISQLILAISL